MDNPAESQHLSTTPGFYPSVLIQPQDPYPDKCLKSLQQEFRLNSVYYWFEYWFFFKKKKKNQPIDRYVQYLVYLLNYT